MDILNYGSWAGEVNWIELWLGAALGIIGPIVVFTSSKTRLFFANLVSAEKKELRSYAGTFFVIHPPLSDVGSQGLRASNIQINKQWFGNPVVVQKDMKTGREYYKGELICDEKCLYINLRSSGDDVSTKSIILHRFTGHTEKDNQVTAGVMTGINIDRNPYQTVVFFSPYLIDQEQISSLIEGPRTDVVDSAFRRNIQDVFQSSSRLESIDDWDSPFS